MKNRKALSCMAASIAVILASCGGSASKYTKEYKGAESFVSDTYHSGYLASVTNADSLYTVELELNGSNYTFTKHLKSVADMSDKGFSSAETFEFKFEFTGEATVDGNDVTLNTPKACTWSESWAALDAYGALKNGSGKATSAEDKTANGDVVFNIFGGEFINIYSADPISVTLSGSTLSFAE